MMNNGANISLSKAFEERDLKSFKDALEKGADPCKPIKNENISVFQKALQSYDCVEFVAACINNKKSLGNFLQKHPQLRKYIINFASASHDPHILSYILNLLHFKDGIASNAEYNNLTPINSLIKDITSENFNDIFKCVKLLIGYKANPNIPDDEGIIPILNIIQNKKLDDIKKKEIIKYLVTLDNPRVIIDTFPPGSFDVQTLLRNNFPEIQLHNATKVGINIQLFSKLGKNKEEEAFINNIKEFESYLSKLDVSFTVESGVYQNLLKITMENGLLEAFEVLLNSKHVTDWDYTKAVDFACLNGYSEALHILLDKDKFNIKYSDGELFMDGILTYWKPKNETCDYKECLSALLESPKIVYKRKIWRQIILYPVNKSEEAMIILLDKGLCNMNGYFIRRIDPKTLEKHFDNCITANNVKHSDHNFIIRIRYNSLLATYRDCDEEDKEDFEGNEGYEINEGNENREDEGISIIKELADCENKRHLLTHPLITSFLYLKWHTLSIYFYLNFIFSFVFCILLVSYIIADFNNVLNEVGRIMLIVLIIFGLVYIIIRETIQAITLKLEMFKTFLVGFSNVIEIALIIFTILTLSYSDYKNDPERSFAVLTILLACVEVYILVGSLPILNLSTHMMMLNAVCWSFIKSFCQYFMFFVTFGLCFHMVFSNTENSTSNEDLSKDSEYFDSAWGSIFKSFIMVTGEFESGDIYFNSPISYGIFLIFVIFMSIVLLNLLTGLAVSDTQMIRERAELNGYISCTYHLARLEKSIIYFKNNRLFSSICEKFTNSFTEYIHGEEGIIILPNIGNEIRSFGRRSFLPGSLSTLTDTRPVLRSSILLRFCRSFNRKSSGMDIKTVQAAIDVLEKKEKLQRQESVNLEQQNRSEKMMNEVEEHKIQLKNIEIKMENRLTNIETKVDEVESHLRNIQGNVEKLLLYLQNPSQSVKL